MRTTPNTPRLHPPSTALRLATLTAVAALMAGCSSETPGDPVTPVPPAVSLATASTAATAWTSASEKAAPDAAPAPTRVVLQTRSGLVTATLDDTPQGRQFAAMLPLRLTLRDPMGQAKSGPLPRPLDVRGAARTTDPAAAVIYYWPPTGDLAIVYDDLGQAVPAPGLVRLGSIDTGLSALASAGNSFTAQISKP